MAMASVAMAWEEHGRDILERATTAAQITRVVFAANLS
jgi:hypothetical protein